MDELDDLEMQNAAATASGANEPLDAASSGSNNNAQEDDNKQQQLQQQEDEHIQLKVVSQNGTDIYFTIRKNTPMSKLMKAYYQRQGVSEQSVRFLFEGARLDAMQTPASLGMEEGDIIDVVLAQTGGSNSTAVVTRVILFIQ